MARDEVVRWGPWSSVVGEYGVLLTEMGSMEDLCTPIKTYPRIKVCDAVSVSSFQPCYDCRVNFKSADLRRFSKLVTYTMCKIMEVEMKQRLLIYNISGLFS